MTRANPYSALLALPLLAAACAGGEQARSTVGGLDSTSDGSSGGPDTASGDPDAGSVDTGSASTTVATDPTAADTTGTPTTDALPVVVIDVEQIDAFLQGPAVTNPNIRVAFAATHPDVLRALSFYGSLADRAFKEVVCASVPAARRAIRTAGSGPPTPAAPRP